MAQIGKFGGFSSVFVCLWVSLKEEHEQAKNSTFSVKLKQKNLSIDSWQGYLIDRKAIFAALEERITHSSLPIQPSAALLNFPKRSELIDITLNLTKHLPQEKPTDYANRVIDEIKQ